MKSRNKFVLEFDEETPIPYYYQLQLFILKKIKENSWKSGDLMPSEREICGTFKVSRSIVRKALENLSQMGFIKKIKGRGNIIIGEKDSDTFIDHQLSFYNYLVQTGYNVYNRLLEFEEIKPPIIVREVLDLDYNEKVYKIKRLRIINKEPWYYDITYLPIRLYPNLNKEDLLEGSLFEMVKKKFNLKIKFQKKYLFALNAKKEDARLLDQEIGDPLHVFENINYLVDGTPSEYSINFCRSDRIIFETKVGKMLPREKIKGVSNKKKKDKMKIIL
jgi:GntR family transcriptional regulator